MISVGQSGSTITPYYSRRIASKTNVDAATVGDTALTFETGLSLSNVIPSFAIIKYRSGTLGTATCYLRIGTTQISDSIALDLFSTNKIFMASIAKDAATLINITDTLYIFVSVANASSASFDIDVFGFVYA